MKRERSGDTSYQVQLALVNIDEAIERHANLALAQIQVEAWKASRHIDLLMERHKMEDAFRKHHEKTRRVR